MTGQHVRLLAVALVLALVWGQCRAQEDLGDGDERTLGLFKPRGQKYSPTYFGGEGGLLSGIGGIFGQLFGGNPYYGHGYGYGGGFGGSPFIGGHPVNPGGYGPGFPPGYYGGGYQHYPGGYGGGFFRDGPVAREIDV